jgi:hypothetical protein
MAGDYSRVTFDATRHFSGVLMQMGRVQLDADTNEQRDILTYYLRALARDLIGPHGGPDNGLAITTALNNGAQVPFDFAISAGRYYVEGILCENDTVVRFSAQPDYRAPASALTASTGYLVYLDTWEQEVRSLQDDRIREVALKGADTAARLRVIWQVRVLELDGAFDENDAEGYLSARLPSSSGLMSARAVPSADDGPCMAAPDARYRGLENQLYRVEIHRGGAGGQATFMWSRDNASAELAVTSVGGRSVELEGLAFDDRSSVDEGDWVQVVDDETPRGDTASPLLQVVEVDWHERRITLSDPAPTVNVERHALLRRWDHKGKAGSELVEGAVSVTEGEWLELEAGIQVWFDSGNQPAYRTGDYWLVPARTATGDVEWPGPPGAPELRPPLGVTHHLAPLRWVSVGGAGEMTMNRDYRRRITPIH